MSSLSLNKIRPTLFLSVPNEQIKLEIQARCNLYLGEVAAIEVVPNRGRDIGPFLSSFEGKHLQDYEFVGHLHTKKTKDREGHVGRVWYRFLLANLLGKQTGMADVILTRMVDEPKLGMVFADDPNLVGWDANLAYATDLADKLGLTSLPTDITFPVGTMFWARTECFTPFLRLGLTWEDYPEEPLAYDGSVLHALERLFPLVVEAGGHEIALTNVPTITR
jgi:lipopolysaccharide biosynthesis protein